MKLLLGKSRALGDAVLLTSTLEAIHKTAKEIELSLLVPSAYSEVYKNYPYLKNIYFSDDPFIKNLWNIRKEKFDYFFQLHASPSQKLLVLASGAKKKKLHYQNNETEQAYGKHPNALEWDRFFLKQELGLDLPFIEPKLLFSEEEKKEAQKFWQAYDVNQEGILFLGIGASRDTKRWPMEYFAEFADLVRNRLGFKIAFVIGPNEEEEKFGAELLNHLRVRGLRPVLDGKGDFIHLVGLSVRKLASILSGVRAYVGNDSGPKHIALASGVRTFTFFGPEDPIEWHPYDRKKHPVFFIENLTCRVEDNGRWCGISHCEIEKHRCMRYLRPQDVFQFFVEGLNKAE
ncbi:MAG: glycosyltransferase family 9 protein [Oligoflexia bacterium]|nr:glycosyltransferase family 9 protein [Oligoflexia bacterium]